MQDRDLAAGTSTTAGATPLPSVCVVVRSYKRWDALIGLLDALRRQDHPDYEIVVIEQSGFSADQRAQLDAKAAAGYPRLRVLYCEPLGSGGALDAGWRQTQKEVVLTIDDDDLPIGERFVTMHAENYLDPNIVAVTGRHVYSPDERCGYRRIRTAKKRCLSYNFFGYPHAYCRIDERVEWVQWVHGTNGSVRKRVIERVGGWDPRSTAHDEHPFSLRLLRLLEPGERLVFDPRPILLRRKDLPGGAGLRFLGAERTYRSWFRYYHGLIYEHYRRRFIAIYPIYPLACTFSAVRWIWKDALGYRSIAHKLADSARTMALSPFWYLQELRRWFRGEPQH